MKSDGKAGPGYDPGSRFVVSVPGRFRQVLVRN